VRSISKSQVVKAHDRRKPEQLSTAHPHFTRRAFVGTTAASSAVLLSGELVSLVKATTSGDSSFPWAEASSPQLQDAMASGELTNRSLTMGYLNRIASLIPLLRGVI
jgi:hypothetical protein